MPTFFSNSEVKNCFRSLTWISFQCCQWRSHWFMYKIRIEAMFQYWQNSIKWSTREGRSVMIWRGFKLLSCPFVSSDQKKNQVRWNNKGIIEIDISSEWKIHQTRCDLFLVFKLFYIPFFTSALSRGNKIWFFICCDLNDNEIEKNEKVL